MDPPVRVIVALDPGKTTGWAVYHCITGLMQFGETAGRFAVYSWVRELAEKGVSPEVVIENWTVRPDTHKMSTQVDPHRIIGYVEGLCEANGWPFTTQMPGEAKSFATDSKLKALGWEATTKGGHARDAARHLLTYMVNRYKHPGEPGHALLLKIAETL